MGRTYDSSKDITLATVGEVETEREGWAILVEIKSMNGAAPKLSMIRTDGESFRRVGRLTEDEALGLALLLDADVLSEMITKAAKKVAVKKAKASKKGKAAKKDGKKKGKPGASTTINFHRLEDDDGDEFVVLGGGKSVLYGKLALSKKVLKAAGMEWDDEDEEWYCDADDWDTASEVFEGKGFTLVENNN